MKKLILILITGIFSIISCERPDFGKSLGTVDGYTSIGSTGEPLQGLTASLPGYGLRTTDANGYFKFVEINPGDYTLTIFQNMNVLSSKDINVEAGKITTVKFYFEYKEQPKKELSDILVVDIESEGITSKNGKHTWDSWVMGEKAYFYIEKNKNNPKFPKGTLFHNFETGESFCASFRDDGSPEVVSAGDLTFVFYNFNSDKGTVDLATIYKSGEIQIDRGLYDYGLSGILKSTKSTSGGNQVYSKSDFIRWTGRVLGAIPCIVSGAAAFVSGGLAIPIAIWVCGNYLLKMSKNFFDDAGVVNGYVELVDGYNLLLGNYTCVATLSVIDCVLSFAFAGIEEYADYVEETEENRDKIDQALELLNKVKIKIIQPGTEGKDAWIGLDKFSDCSEYYSASPNDSLMKFEYEVSGACQKLIKVSLLEFPLNGIPADATISSASLDVYGFAVINYKDRIPTISLDVLLGSWTESGVTWENQPKTDDLIPIQNLDFINKGSLSWYSWDVTEAVRYWVAGIRKNYGFKISTKENTVYGKVYSSDHPNAHYRPKLTITYY